MKRRRRVIGNVFVAILSVSAIVFAVGGVSPSVDGAFAADRPLGQRAEPIGPPVACSSLDPSELPNPRPRHGTSTVHDIEHGLLQMTYETVSRQEKTITVDYVNDAGCKGRPELDRIVQHARSTTAETTSQTCRLAQELLDSGATKNRGRTINRGALAQHVARWCRQPPPEQPAPSLVIAYNDERPERSSWRGFTFSRSIGSLTNGASHADKP